MRGIISVGNHFCSYFSAIEPNSDILEYAGGIKPKFITYLDVILAVNKSSHRRCLVKMMFLKVSLPSQKNQPLLGSLFNKFASLKACNFIQKRLQHSCF